MSTKSGCLPPCKCIVVEMSGNRKSGIAECKVTVAYEVMGGCLHDTDLYMPNAWCRVDSPRQKYVRMLTVYRAKECFSAAARM